jgi:hypothetical protein
MIKRRSKFWTVIFSFLPGSGHMFMGFMKQGVSYMSMFFLIIFLASWLDISPLLFVLPVLWFYSFFDAINKMSLANEDFYQQEDHFILPDFLWLEQGNLHKQKLFFGIGLILLGVYLIWDNLLINLGNFLPEPLRSEIWRFNQIVPQLVLGVIILIAGVRLIRGQRREDASSGQNA